MVENGVRSISTSVDRILASMVEFAMIHSTTTRVHACQAIRDGIVNSTSTTAHRILAKMPAHASIMSTITNASARFPSPDVIVNQKWTHVHRIVVVMEHVARQVQTIRTFSARVQLDMLEDIAMRTSMSANFHHRAEMVQHARTPMDHITASVRKATRAKIARSTPMTVHRRLVTMAELVSMELVITLACATMDLRASTARLTSTSAYLSLVSMVPHANNMSILTLAPARSASLASIVKSTMKIARRHRV